MSSKKPFAWVSLLKDYWWLAGVIIALGSTISLWAAMPKRLEKVEVKNEKQDADIVDLKGVAKSIEGYTKAMQQMQQAPSRPRAPETLREHEDGVGYWCCDHATREACWEPDTNGRNSWTRCE